MKEANRISLAIENDAWEPMMYEYHANAALPDLSQDKLIAVKTSDLSWRDLRDKLAVGVSRQAAGRKRRIDMDYRRR